MNHSTNTRHAPIATAFATAAASVVTAATIIAIGSVSISQANAGPQCGVPHIKSQPDPTPFSSTFIAHTGGKAVVGP